MHLFHMSMYMMHVMSVCQSINGHGEDRTPLLCMYVCMYTIYLSVCLFLPVTLLLTCTYSNLTRDVVLIRESITSCHAL